MYLSIRIVVVVVAAAAAVVVAAAAAAAAVNGFISTFLKLLKTFIIKNERS